MEVIEAKQYKGMNAQGDGSFYPIDGGISRPYTVAIEIAIVFESMTGCKALLVQLSTPDRYFIYGSRTLANLAE